jgi:hypothetical protein
MTVRLSVVKASTLDERSGTSLWATFRNIGSEDCPPGYILARFVVYEEPKLTAFCNSDRLAPGEQIELSAPISEEADVVRIFAYLNEALENFPLNCTFTIKPGFFGSKVEIAEAPA